MKCRRAVEFSALLVIVYVILDNLITDYGLKNGLNYGCYSGDGFAEFCCLVGPKETENVWTGNRFKTTAQKRIYIGRTKEVIEANYLSFGIADYLGITGNGLKNKLNYKRCLVLVGFCHVAGPKETGNVCFICCLKITALKQICIYEITEANYSSTGSNIVFSSTQLAYDFSKYTGKHRRAKVKRANSRICYYANSVATYQLLLAAGDIHPHPGPVVGVSQSKQKKSPASRCPNCEKPVKKKIKNDLSVKYAMI